MIDFSDNGTVETVLKTLDAEDERSVLVGLDLAENLAPQLLAHRLPRSLLRHPSSEVRRRALMCFARSSDASVLAEVFGLLASEAAQVQAEAIKTVFSILKKDAVHLIHPLLKSPEIEVRSAATQCLLQTESRQIRQDAFDALRNLLADQGHDGEISRIAAARIMGELREPDWLIEGFMNPDSAVGINAPCGGRCFRNVVRLAHHPEENRREDNGFLPPSILRSSLSRATLYVPKQCLGTVQLFQRIQIA